jgi:hypothetical protein
VYAHNVGAVFDENYSLASTQQRKNKDIPEGGSKGTIFLSQNHQDKAEIAFRQYIDALCDLLIKDDEIVDYLQDEEILFLGPDEGTAEYMDWASQHARRCLSHSPFSYEHNHLVIITINMNFPIQSRPSFLEGVHDGQVDKPGRYSTRRVWNDDPICSPICVGRSAETRPRRAFDKQVPDGWTRW